MFSDPNCLDKFCALLVGTAVTGCTLAIGAPPTGALEAVVAGGGLYALLRDRKNSSEASVMRTFRKELELHWKAWGAHSSHADEGMRGHVVASFETVIGRVTLSPAEVAEAHASAPGVADLIVARAAELEPELYRDRGPHHADSHLARDFLHQLTQNAYARLLQNGDFFNTLRPALWERLLDGQQEIQRDTEKILELLQGRLDLTEREKSELLQETSRLKSELGSTYDLIKGFLASILDRDIPAADIPKSLFQLAGQWKLAGQRIDALEASRNLNPEVASLRDRARAAYDAESADEAFALLRQIEKLETDALDRLRSYRRDLEAEEELRVRGLIETKSAMTALALAAFDADLAARLRVEIIDLDTPDPAGRFDALRAEFMQWNERGRDRGLRLDLEVAIALARIARARATSADQRGAALNDLAIVLSILGARESGTARLEEAVAALRAALEERTRDRAPLDWAATQNNLGAALRTLGERETGTARLEEAVTAFRAALEEHTRDRVPLDWAMTQNNLGNALLILGARETGTARLEGAIEAYRAALEERTRDRVPLDWAMTQNNLGNALATVGMRETGTARLEEAATAYRAALEERTRDRVPLDWAKTRGNMCNLHLALFDRTGTAAELDLAQAALDNAREVFAEAQVSQYLAMADNMQAQIDARRRR